MESIGLDYELLDKSFELSGGQKKSSNSGVIALDWSY